MKLFHWASSHGNFGDDMNAFIWPHFLPGVFDDDADALFVGIGTIFSADIPKARHRIVMGSGTGYGRLPPDLKDGGWHIYAVRGPLTARAIGGEPNLAVADPAILLPLMPEFAPTPRRGIAFVPHWTTAQEGLWQSACAQAGIEFIDPRGEAKGVIRRIAAAELIIAESMHGAIVADAFRVPWVAIVSGRDTPMKWHDWALALGMNYRPYEVGRLSLVSILKGRSGVSSARLHTNAQEYAAAVDASVRAFVQRSSQPVAAAKVTIAPRIKESIRGTLDRVARSVLVDRGSQILTQVSKLPTTLSADGILRERQAELVRRMELFRRDCTAGAFAPSRRVG